MEQLARVSFSCFFKLQLIIFDGINCKKYLPIDEINYIWFRSIDAGTFRICALHSTCIQQDYAGLLLVTGEASCFLVSVYI